jgi:hypothetical protein
MSGCGTAADASFARHAPPAGMVAAWSPDGGLLAFARDGVDLRPADGSLRACASGTSGGR